MKRRSLLAMNILEARVGDDGRSIVTHSSTIGFDHLRLRLPATGMPVLFGIRPEHVAVSSEAKVDMLLTVAAVETLGADAFAHCRIAGNEKGPDFVVRIPGTAAIQVGERLPVTLDRNAVHLFDAESKRRL